MASKTHPTSALLLSTFNLIFITFVSSSYVPCSSPSPPPKDYSYNSPPKPYYPESPPPPPPPKDYSNNSPPKPYLPKSPPPPKDYSYNTPPPKDYSYNSPPKPYYPESPPPPPKDYSYASPPLKPYQPKSPPPPKDYSYTSPPPKPYYPKSPPPPYYYYPKETCSIDTLKFGVCVNLLDPLVRVVVGTPPDAPHCCSLIKDLVDCEAAACLCTALKANVLGVRVDISLDLSLLFNHCERKVPYGFQCDIKTSSFTFQYLLIFQ